MRENQSRATQEKHERLLNDLFKLPGNDKCADCTAKHPRWASYSLGVFLCIRCGSLHRKMGTHISKVKSVSMDRWTLQEIQNMAKSGGNDLVNNQINASPRKFTLPIALDDDHAMERYIRDKWERKLFREESVKEFISSSSQDSSQSITDLQQRGNSTMSLSTVDLHTPSLSSISSSSLVSSPTLQFAGRVSMDNNSSNPFLAKQDSSSYNPFSTSFTSPSMTPPILSPNNPFLRRQQQQLVQTPFDFSYDINSTNGYFNTVPQSSNNIRSHNPFQ